MSSLNVILNRDEEQDEHDRHDVIVESPRSLSPSPEEPTPPKKSSESYYQSSITIRPHEPHEHCPDTLDCLPDTTGRPQHTLPVILRCAILGSPKKKLTIREIYAAMERKYPYYLSAGPAWKQSVRHHLSLNRLFEREPRPATEPGFGSYWTVNLEAPPGTKRPRKRGVRKEAPPPEPIIVERRRERHRRSREARSSPYGYAPPLARLRPVDAHSFSTPAVRNDYDVDDEDDDNMLPDDSPADSDDEQEIEDSYRRNKVIHKDDYEGEIRRIESHKDPFKYDPRMNMAASSSSLTLAELTPYQAPKAMLHGAFASHTYLSHQHQLDYESPHSIVKRLSMEMEVLKRQSNEALSISYQMTEQLKDVKSESAKIKAALRVAESRLEDEKRRRVEAEMAADEESRRRQEAEDTLRTLQSLPFTRAPKQR